MGNILKKTNINSQLKNVDNQLQKEIELNKALTNLQSVYKLRLFYISILIFPLIYFYFRNKNILIYSIIYFIIIFIINILFDKLFSYKIYKSLKNIEYLEKKQVDMLNKLHNKEEINDIINMIQKNKRRELIKKNLKKRNISLDKYELERKLNKVDQFRESVIDLVIGEDPRLKFALICKECGTHNGLSLPENIKNKFECYYCAFMNEKEIKK